MLYFALSWFTVMKETHLGVSGTTVISCPTNDCKNKKAAAKTLLTGKRQLLPTLDL